MAIMAPSGITQPVKAARAHPSEALLLISVLALIALDLAHLTIGSLAGAAALAAFAVAYAKRWHTPSFGFYGLVIAELSAIGLGADLTTVVVYQALCLLLLTSVIAPFPRLGKLRTYAMPALITAVVAVAALVPGIAAAYAKWLTAAQAAALSGVIVLGLAFALARLRRPALSRRPVEA
jgi:hypothetical protein